MKEVLAQEEQGICSYKRVWVKIHTYTQTYRSVSAITVFTGHKSISSKNVHDPRVLKRIREDLEI